MEIASTSVTARQCTSPVKPDNDATEPKEKAKCAQTHLFSTPAVHFFTDAEKMATESQCCGEASSIMGENEWSLVLVTKEMMEEEKQLKEEGEKEEQQLRKEQDELWEQLEENDKEQRYQRLQFLLQRSNMYTQYLINRMKKQQEEEAKRKERRARKQAKQEYKQKDKEGKQGKNGVNGNMQESCSQDATNFADISDCHHSLRIRKRKQVHEPSKSSLDGAQKIREPKRRKVAEPAQEEETTSPISYSDTAETADTLNNNAENRTFDGEVVSNAQPLLVTGGILRPYQIDGYLWLKTLYENGVNGILADEMGLGKTVQCVAMFAHLVYMGVSGPFLICAPLSTIPNWYSEFQKFAPKVPVMLYHGSKDERQSLRQKIPKLHEIRNGVKVHPCVITSYEVAMMDRKYLQNYDWRYLVVDEGHRIKNTHCRLIGALRMYKTTNRLLLTGTPLQNNLAELWSLLNFLLPEIFDDLGSFEAWFDLEHIGNGSACKQIVADERRKNVLSMLHQILTPFMLRRLKTDVDLHIPPKKEILVYTPLRPLQQEFYAGLIDKTIFSKIQTKNGTAEKVEVDSNGRPVRRCRVGKVDYGLMIASGNDEKVMKTRRSMEQQEEELEDWVQSLIGMQQKRQSKPEPEQKVSQLSIKLRNVMMQLRKCCSHPFLLEHPLDPKTGELSLDERIITESGKMMVLDCMMAELKKRGHKVLIFSQMTKMLDLLEDFCHLRNYGYCRLDGSMNIIDRKENMQEYQKNEDKFVFLLSTRAGGLGINLTAADTVIIYDSDWNPQCDLQAQDRCHRIGQTRPVMVYRLVTANTIDQRIVERAAAKRKLEKLVIHQGKFKSGIKNFKTSLDPISSEELLELLNSKDYESEVRGCDGQEVISKTELDQLLDRSDLEAKWAAKRNINNSGNKPNDHDLASVERLPCMSESSPTTAESNMKCKSKSQEISWSGSHQPLFKVLDIDEDDP
ncbi:lymphocyte-specific helicase-like isoform X1 [Pomacea canaliculata]|uniref:lymphocyte-specific helicase-like isoform X1 n=1 Tax=Pomacea canaliculata TaxID=400727 RepID=UPI000D725654|nr:lymphocyte-specific helicase-like isoform X1 [Pomacea canaliculata]